MQSTLAFGVIGFKRRSLLWRQVQNLGSAVAAEYCLFISAKVFKAAAVLVVATTLCSCHLGKTGVGGVVHIKTRHLIKAYDGLIMNPALFFIRALRNSLDFRLNPASKFFIKTRAR